MRKSYPQLYEEYEQLPDSSLRDIQRGLLPTVKPMERWGNFSMAWIVGYIPLMMGVSATMRTFGVSPEAVDIFDKSIYHALPYLAPLPLAVNAILNEFGERGEIQRRYFVAGEILNEREEKRRTVEGMQSFIRSLPAE